MIFNDEFGKFKSFTGTTVACLCKRPSTNYRIKSPLKNDVCYFLAVLLVCDVWTWYSMSSRPTFLEFWRSLWVNSSVCWTTATPSRRLQILQPVITLSMRNVRCH